MSSAVARALPRSEINVTPLVDVVLVLLVIFIVVTPILRASLDVELPEKGTSTPPVAPANPVIAVQLGPAGRIAVNHQPVASEAELTVLVRDLVRTRHPDRIYVSSDPSVAYSEVVRLVDLVARCGEGAKRIPVGLILPARP